METIVLFLTLYLVSEVFYNTEEMRCSDALYLCRGGSLSREEFIKNHWKPYPSPYFDQAFSYGRWFKDEHGVHWLIKQDQKSVIHLLNDKTTNHPVFGKPIPVECLHSGDVIAVSKEGLAYLLSPNLKVDFVFCPEIHKWSLFLESVKNFFLAKDFYLTPTPTLVHCPGVDHHIDVFAVEGQATARQYYLPTSPEIHLKKLLCQGYEKIFEINKSFRDDLDSPSHLPEFRMLEWYRAYSPLSHLKEDVMGLIGFLTNSEVSYQEKSMAQLFDDCLNFKLTPETSLSDLKDLICKLKIDSHPSDDWNDTFFRIFIDKIEPELAPMGLLVITDFPAQQASLSQIHQGWSQRFEVYWNGVELANAYLEVNDPIENQRRFLSEAQLKHQKGSKKIPMDQEFFSLMRQGLPPASGIALGLNRLYALVQGLTEVDKKLGPADNSSSI